jgi:hypothetical protein
MSFFNVHNNSLNTIHQNQAIHSQDVVGPRVTIDASFRLSNEEAIQLKFAQTLDEVVMHKLCAELIKRALRENLITIHRHITPFDPKSSIQHYTTFYTTLTIIKPITEKDSNENRTTNFIGPATAYR